MGSAPAPNPSLEPTRYGSARTLGRPMKISMRRWIRAIVAGVLAGFAILGGQATFLDKLPPSGGYVLSVVGFTLAITFLATLAAARWVWPYTDAGQSPPRTEPHS